MGITRGGNKTGAKWNKGGALSRNRMLDIDFSCFGDYAEKLDNLGADLKKIFGDAMEQAAETVQEDTAEAMESANLPAHGEYSRGVTKEAIIRDAKTEWRGSFGEIGMGFDKTMPGAGGFLITGTPRMRPNYKLEDIYNRKKYKSKIMKQISEELQEAIKEKIGG